MIKMINKPKDASQCSSQEYELLAIERVLQKCGGSLKAKMSNLASKIEFIFRVKVARD